MPLAKERGKIEFDLGINGINYMLRWLAVFYKELQKFLNNYWLMVRL